MAEKGDFLECEKCTSFQCVTCGLEATRGEGAITGRKNAFKACFYCALGIIGLYSLNLTKITFYQMLSLLSFSLVGMYIAIRSQISVVFVYLLIMCMSAVGLLFHWPKN